MFELERELERVECDRGRERAEGDAITSENERRFMARLHEIPERGVGDSRD